MTSAKNADERKPCYECRGWIGAHSPGCPAAPAPEPRNEARHPCGHLMVSDECVVCAPDASASVDDLANVTVTDQKGQCWDKREWCEFLPGSNGEAAWNTAAKLTRELADARAERDKLREIINSDAECLPGCDSYGHVEGCPYADILAHFLSLKAELARARGLLRALRAKYADTVQDFDPKEWGMADADAFLSNSTKEK
jgi:hypothetical protein